MNIYHATIFTDDGEFCRCSCKNAEDTLIIAKEWANSFKSKNPYADFCAIHSAHETSFTVSVKKRDITATMDVKKFARIIQDNHGKLLPFQLSYSRLPAGDIFVEDDAKKSGIFCFSFLCSDNITKIRVEKTKQFVRSLVDPKEVYLRINTTPQTTRCDLPSGDAGRRALARSYWRYACVCQKKALSILYLFGFHSISALII